MKCPKCGYDIPNDDLFCPNCGAEIRIVPDYNLFEEDILSSMIADGDKKPNKKDTTSLKNDPEKNKKSGSPKNRNRVIIFILILIVFGTIIGIGTYKYLNSYTYIMDNAASYVKKGKYSYAYNKYLKAAEKFDSAKAYTEAARIQYKLKNKSKAESLLYKAIDSDSGYKEAYNLLITIYQEEKDYDALSELKESTDNSKIKLLFKNIVTGRVTFSKAGGKYNDDLEITLKTSGNYDIYYTIDGKEPGKSEGTKFTEPIVLAEGKTVIKAVCVNPDGQKGAVAKEIYDISYERPVDPVVSPESGSFVKPEKITISAEGGCRIFYTWDESDPTVNSAEYTGPIDMLPGNNVLSVIAIDEHELSSDIVRKNYIFNQ
jgi:hypothetical protein